MDNLIIATAQYLIIVPVIFTIYLTLNLQGQNRKNYIILLVAGGLLALILAKLGSSLYDNPRPFISDGVTPLFAPRDDNGFPSDHTLLAAFLGFAALYYSKKIGVLLLVFALIIGWSRVAAGVHHAVDIAGGFLAAGLAVLSVHYIINKLELSRKKSMKEEKQKSQQHAKK